MGPPFEAGGGGGSAVGGRNPAIMLKMEPPSILPGNDFARLSTVHFFSGMLDEERG